MMKKPEKPTKKIEIQNCATYNFDGVSKKVVLSNFLEWAKKTAPKGSKDITLELVEEWMYDDCYTYLQLAWKEVKDNPHYEYDMVKYKKKLKNGKNSWHKQVKIHNCFNSWRLVAGRS
jgi:hypothetical protein